MKGLVINGVTQPWQGQARSHSPVARFHTRLKQRPAEAFLALRALAVSLGPDVVERVDDTQVAYLRGSRPFMAVHPAKSRLHLVFPSGIALDDPNGRLLKRGEEHYVTLEGPESVDGHVQEFVRKAYAALR